MEGLLKFEENFLLNTILRKDERKDKDVYVFMEVTVPYMQFVFSNGVDFESNLGDLPIVCWSVNGGWEEIHERVKDVENQTMTIFYAYAKNSIMTPLSNGVTTPTLFDCVSTYSGLKGQEIKVVFVAKSVNKKGKVLEVKDEIKLKL